ncbi:hypothetical protein NDU88_006378 [Pleurodeles waltl]|uniref:Uncharacterized protein n=1 Tax=Pleurodeles waltl TaxID=8319 RepID=A0AAV7N2V1_PLEWA|nr:hypothetical protein NDU88_006378 [Pleurodeles waltl]
MCSPAMTRAEERTGRGWRPSRHGLLRAAWQRRGCRVPRRNRIPVGSGSWWGARLWRCSPLPEEFVVEGDPRSGHPSPLEHQLPAESSGGRRFHTEGVAVRPGALFRPGRARGPGWTGDRGGAEAAGHGSTPW